MKLLFVAKREPQQRDLIARPYGRFHFLPTELARRGHDVRMLLVSHRSTAATEVVRNGVRVATFNPRDDGLLRTLSALDAEALSWKPDWIVGCSDTWHGWLAHRLAKRAGAALAIDAYDNYESYMPWNAPLHHFWRRAVAAADAVTAAGPQLAVLLDRHRAQREPAVIVPMAADPGFTPTLREDARLQLDLPPAAPLLGYFGSWAKSRSTDLLLEAFRLVRERQPSSRFVLTGRPPAHALSEPGILPLGYIPDELLPIALSALDVACVITADTPFGRYSYPAKLCEAMACGVPVVATATEPVRWMLGDDSRFLVPVGDAPRISERILSLLDAGRIAYPELPSWETSARHFEQALLRGKAIQS